ncbi:Acetyltransferase (GNAT) domain-containing protein [Nonomuraea solani]|uniref:Acetyltransferase (GNAT) domain-containing protein n=1 Tax=Nonomuraea solani TaxID=1144553 RepID=A0A1H6BJ22_9ACTN|nr:Acetyltransferase (GNAT) domain-containing protein [Nonomuraea solani]
MPDATSVVSLPGGLVLRQARPADLDQIGALLTERMSSADAVDHRLVVTDPDAGWGSCAVVTDGDRVVSTATLLDEELRIGGLRLPAGQVELVATDREYEGRGLVRALMRWAHDRSAARGHVVQVMIGITYFYRRFGYEYAIDIQPALPLRTLPPADDPTALRPARPSDLPALTALQDAAQSGFDVTMPHSVPCWRWLLAHEASTVWAVERAGAVVASGRTLPPDDEEILLAEGAAADEAAAADLLRGVAALVPGGQVRGAGRLGTVWRDLLRDEERPPAEQYYVRIPDPAALLDRLRPVLWNRLVTAGIDHGGRDLVISTFGAHHRIPVHADGLGEVSTGGPMQAPASMGGAGVAPDYLPALLFGPHGIDGLSRIRPDVYCGPEKELYQALFPPLTADLLTYYLPY